MGTVTISIATMDEVKGSLLAAFTGEKQGEFITFPSLTDMMRNLTSKRWELIQAMTGKGPMSVRHVAHLVNRDVKSVHGDVHALMLTGVIDKTEDGQVVFPYDAIHVDFTLGKAA